MQINPNILGDVGVRLRAERERLGLNQSDFGRAGGVSRNSQADYEKGATPCTVAYLNALTSIGVDADYVFSGLRDERMLDAEEAGLIACFRVLDVDEREAVLRMVEVMAGRKRPDPTVHAPKGEYRAQSQ